MLSAAQFSALLTTLEARFTKHPARHAGLSWAAVKTQLEAHPEKCQALHEMERTGGEPDVVSVDAKTGTLLFFDCSPETPKGRTSLCYDKAGLDSRKEHKPENNAVDVAATMGVRLLTEAEYFQLQELGEFDLKTSSWLLTPADIRQRGGALFGDRRYGRVFIYHNGAQSYYSARAFRAALSI